MIQKCSNFRLTTLKKPKMSQKIAVLSTKKGLIRYLLCIKPIFTYGEA